MWNDATVNHQLDLLVSAIGQVAQSPDGVDKDVHVRVVNEVTEGRKDLIDRLDGRWWVLVAAQIDDNPGDVAQEADGNIRFNERQKRRNDAALDDIIAQLRSIADDVSESPDCLFAYIGSW